MQGYRTIAFNGLMGVLIIAAEVVQALGMSPEVQYFLNEAATPYVMLAILVANVFLRVVTTTPVGQKP